MGIEYIFLGVAIYYSFQLFLIIGCNLIDKYQERKDKKNGRPYMAPPIPRR